MSRVTTTISIEADRDYINTLGIVAKIQNKSIGRLVREACDAVHASDIEQAQAVLRPSSVASTQETFDQSNKTNHAANAQR